MMRIKAGGIFAILMIVLIVSLDILFFKHHMVERLIVNIGVVLVSLGFYLRFFKK